MEIRAVTSEVSEGFVIVAGGNGGAGGIGLQRCYLPLPRRRKRKKKMRHRPHGAPVETLPAGDCEPFPLSFSPFYTTFVSFCSALKGGELRKSGDWNSLAK